MVILHIWALHVPGSNNPVGVEVKNKKDTLPFYPYFVVKDGLAVVSFMIFYAYFMFYIPNYLGHADNYIEANPLVTPAHIVPEWYFLPYYAMLRAVPNEARRRLRPVRVDPAAGVSSVARHVAGALGELPPRVPGVPVRVVRHGSVACLGYLRVAGADRLRT